jgi:hypothetical protein
MWPETDTEAEADTDLGFVEMGKTMFISAGCGLWCPWVKSTIISLISDAVEVLQLPESGIDGTLLLVQISAIPSIWMQNLGTFQIGGSTSLLDFMGSSWATYTPATPPHRGTWPYTWVDYDIAYIFVILIFFLKCLHSNCLNIDRARKNQLLSKAKPGSLLDLIEVDSKSIGDHRRG